MNSNRQRSMFSRLSSVLRCVALLAVTVLTPAVFAQLRDTIGVKNWPMSKSSGPGVSNQISTGGNPGLVYIGITPCRVMDTRGQGGSGKTGVFGPPSLVAGQMRVVPVPSSNCGVPAAAAYSLNFVSVTPVGQTVGWVAAWQDDTTWPGTVVVNAPLGGIVDNSAIVPAGADGGIQLLTTNNGDLVIDMNGYFVQATTIQGPPGQQGPVGDTGMTGATGAPSTVAGPAGLTGVAGGIGPAGPGGPQGVIGNNGATGTAGPSGPNGAPSTVAGPVGPTGVAGAVGPAGPGGPQGVIGNNGATGPAGPSGPNGAASTVAGPVGPTGVAGAVGPAGPSGPQGVIGNNGATGPAGPSGPNGAASTVAGPVGSTGVAGAVGPAGPSGPSGSFAFADFFALMPGDNGATIGIGTDVSFPQTGSSSFSAITRTSASTFNLAAVGTYQVIFQVSVNEAGQLNLTLNGADQLSTSVGRATGTSQIVGMSLVTTTVINSILTVRNPASNSTALTITPLAGGTRAVSAHLVIMQIQ
jgi:hypothetical protein